MNLSIQSFLKEKQKLQNKGVFSRVPPIPVLTGAVGVRLLTSMGDKDWTQLENFTTLKQKPQKATKWIQR